MFPLLAHPESVRTALHPPTTAEGEGIAPSRRASVASAEDPARLTDEELLSRYREQGRADDCDELVRRFGGELYRYLVRYLGDPTLADDVLQNIFLQVHAKGGLYQAGQPVRPWLYAIATHQAVNALRRAGRQAAVSLDQRLEAGEPGAWVDLLVGEGPSPLEELQEEERRQWVRDSVARLPELLHQTLILAYYQGLKYHEIAEVLGIPVGTVKSRLHSAIAKLRAMAREAYVVEARTSSRRGDPMEPPEMREGDPMEPPEMLDYVLGLLDGPQREQAERAIAADPPLAEALTHLAHSLGQLLDDGREVELPAELARRLRSGALDRDAPTTGLSPPE
ncbi:MAG: sigma-70 family RNA polymerase sigma factor [Planctomycetaceae bacterium]